MPGRRAASRKSCGTRSERPSPSAQCRTRGMPLGTAASEHSPARLCRGEANSARLQTRDCEMRFLRQSGRALTRGFIQTMPIAIAIVCTAAVMDARSDRPATVAEMCADQVRKSSAITRLDGADAEARLRKAIDAANANAKGGYADLRLFLEMTLVQPVHGLKEPWL